MPLLQEKEEERLRAVLERDELMSQCEEEKNRFSTLANQVLRRSASEVSTSSLMEVEALSRVRKLEDELFKKNQALTVSAMQSTLLFFLTKCKQPLGSNCDAGISRILSQSKVEILFLF